jgi:predicted lipase
MGQQLDKPLALFYGKFVQAAYTMYRHPQGPDPLRPAPAGIPDGYELGAWIQMTDFIFDVTEVKFYGIVAHSKADPDARVIAIRGTEGAIEWFDDAAALPVPFRQVPGAGRVAYGFDKIYNTLNVVPCPLPGERLLTAEAAPKPFAGSFGEQLEQLALMHEASRRTLSGAPAIRTEETVRPPRPTVVTAHSLGAALATLFVMENAARGQFEIETLCTFASPRVGNLEFARRFDQLPVNSWRIVNSLDVVPKIPPHIPMVLEYDHVDTAYPFRSSDFARNSLLCWHTMETYLHWLDNRYSLLPECMK